tara:strand:+ start:9238 stop:9420 length:183 start_codon:yes stop_codon:yes gene_type:complete
MKITQSNGTTRGLSEIMDKSWKDGIEFFIPLPITDSIFLTYFIGTMNSQHKERVLEGVTV